VCPLSCAWRHKLRDHGNGADLPGSQGQCQGQSSATRGSRHLNAILFNERAYLRRV
jgi:hypothetical protein